MAPAKSQPTREPKKSTANGQNGITAIMLEGYKSIYHKSKIDISPLTVLAGTNSSGKSSIMQPILLMKQTLEANYDPGPVLINGPNLKFTSAEQLFSVTDSKEKPHCFKVGVEISDNAVITCTFEKKIGKSIELKSMKYEDSERHFTLTAGMVHDELINSLPSLTRRLYEELFEGASLGIVRNGCFFEVAPYRDTDHSVLNFNTMSSPASIFEDHIQKIIHVPGLRGNPERTYKTTAVSNLFPGTFENYVASVIDHWQSSQDQKLHLLTEALQKLNLTSKIESKQINDTQVELRVGKLPCNSKSKNKKKDMVSIVDVGFGVSQVLPVLVSLLAASPGQLVYIEQPEIHLHPRAQVALAEIFAEAIDAGIRVVVETHSELFLLGIQSLVAEGRLSPDNVKLHWFTRQADGATQISSAELDETGAFGDWPEDFGEISLAAQNRYLTAAEAKLWKESGK